MRLQKIDQCYSHRRYLILRYFKIDFINYLASYDSKLYKVQTTWDRVKFFFFFVNLKVILTILLNDLAIKFRIHLYSNGSSCFILFLFLTILSVLGKNSSKNYLNAIFCMFLSSVPGKFFFGICLACLENSVFICCLIKT